MYKKDRHFFSFCLLKLHLNTNFIHSVFLYFSKTSFTKLRVQLRSASYEQHLMHINHFGTGMQAIKDIFHPWRKWMTTTIKLWNYTMLITQSNPVHQRVTSWTSEHSHWSLKQTFQSAHSKTNPGSGLSWDQFKSISRTEVWPTNAQRYISDTFMHKSTCAYYALKASGLKNHLKNLVIFSYTF